MAKKTKSTPSIASSWWEERSKILKSITKPARRPKAKAKKSVKAKKTKAKKAMKMKKATKAKKGKKTKKA